MPSQMSMVGLPLSAALNCGIEHDQGDVEIITYKRTILLFTTDAEVVRRLAGNDKKGEALWTSPSFAVGHLARRYQNMDESSRNAPLGEAGAQTSAAFLTPNV